MFLCYIRSYYDDEIYLRQDIMHPVAYTCCADPCTCNTCIMFAYTSVCCMTKYCDSSCFRILTFSLWRSCSWFARYYHAHMFILSYAITPCEHDTYMYLIKSLPCKKVIVMQVCHIKIQKYHYAYVMRHHHY